MYIYSIFFPITLIKPIHYKKFRRLLESAGIPKTKHIKKRHMFIRFHATGKTLCYKKTISK